MWAAIAGNEAMVDYCLAHHCNVDLQDEVSKIASYHYRPWYTSSYTLTNPTLYSLVIQPCTMQLIFMVD